MGSRFNGRVCRNVKEKNMAYDIYKKRGTVHALSENPRTAENIIKTLCEMLSDRGVNIVDMYDEIRTIVADDGKNILTYRW